MRFSIILVLLAALCSVGGTLAGEGEKPTIKVAPDGFPTGRASPEGAACGLARAFIKRDNNPA
jgi:hypothetical protein